jgi:SAM-dependent methyltransferase
VELQSLKTLNTGESSCCEPGCCADAESVKAAVREQYGKVATGESSCCEPACCADAESIKATVREQYGKVASGEATCGALCGCTDNAEALATTFGYTVEELATLPEGANLGLSCGNPQALASIRPGETVLDLGSGAGFDCFLAARRVGPSGRVIGVDMTDAMLHKARANAEQAGFSNVEFREGDIEALPVDDSSVDVVISNCVLNLVPDKDRAFREIHRVLKPGGRLAVSDMAWETEPAASVRKDMEALVGCIGGALVLDDYVARLKRAGFVSVRVERHAEAARKMVEVSGVIPPPGIEHLLSVNLTATK